MPTCGNFDTLLMNKEEFKELLKKMDTDGDGKISREELRLALRKLGLNYNGLRMWWNVRGAISHADLNGNKHIDGDREIERLIAYAQKNWGIKLN